MKSNKPKHFALKATSMAVLLMVGSSMTLADGAADMDNAQDYETPELTWQETKRSAVDYWQDFKQDSQQTWASSKDAFRDGWVEGKLQTAIVLNSHLNPFDIDISVDNNTATLQGEVDSAVQKELATQLALGIEGIDEVNNTIKVEKTEKTEKTADNSETMEDTNSETMKDNKDYDRSFGNYVADTVLTADLKTDLMASDTISALDINVDVNRSEVTLTGNVGSEAEKDLAEIIVKNNPDVESVNNHLKIQS